MTASRSRKDVLPVSPGQISIEEIRDLVGRPDPVFLEIGANNGYHTVRFARAFPQGRIIAFEPEPRAIRKWHRHVTLPNAELHEIAISDRDGTAVFHQSGGREKDTPGGWDLSGSLRAPKSHLERYPDIEFKTRIEVPTRSLDSWCEEHGIDEIDFIWTDVQGAECDLVAGGRMALGRTRFFYTEYYDVEMYSGQWTLETLADNLPDHRMSRRWAEDVLFEREGPRPNQ